MGLFVRSKSGESKLGVVKYLGSNLVPSNESSSVDLRWVFSPPKLILLSKLIFKQNDVACLVRVARFVRNGK